ncbi:MAG: hypothetical protein HY908_24805 [Myxococcales bacterium]|nr:hypothetical protein [Myxococcales bacterium]
MPEPERERRAHLARCWEARPIVPGVNRRKPLVALCGVRFGPPDFPSHLVTTCHRLHDEQPLRSYSVEDLRIMIGQGIDLPYLVPIALEVLAREPLSSGDYYEGDLLVAALRVPPAFWLVNPAARRTLVAIVEPLSPPRDLAADVAAFVRRSP